MGMSMNMDMMKVSKREANYRKAPRGDLFICTNCIHYNEISDGVGTCDVVEGIVTKGHTSDLFSPDAKLLDVLSENPNRNY